MTKNSRLKIAREKIGMSQHDLASKLPLNKDGNPINQSYIAQLEKGKGFSLKRAKEISQILGIDYDWLFFGNIEGNKGNNNTQSGEDKSHNDLNVRLSKSKEYTPYENIFSENSMEKEKEIDKEDLLSNQEFLLAEVRETNRLIKKLIEVLTK